MSKPAYIAIWVVESHVDYLSTPKYYSQLQKWSLFKYRKIVIRLTKNNDIIEVIMRLRFLSLLRIGNKMEK